MLTEKKGKRILGMLLALLLVFNAVLQGGMSVLAAAKVVDIDITKFEIQNKDRQTVDKIFFTDEFYLMMQWDATKNGANIHEGDYFDVKLPDKMQFPSDTTARDFDLTDEHGVVLAKAHVTPGPGDVGGSIHVVFTDKVENKYNVKGTMYLAARFDREKVLKDDENNFTITVNSDVVGMEQSGTDGVIITGPKELVNEYLNKWGGKIQGDPNQVGWHVRINHTKANLTNMVVTDTLSLPNEKFIPESFSLRQVTFDKYGDIVTGSEVAVDLTGKLTFEAENKTFKLNLGNVTGQQYYFEYNSTYTPGTKLSNKVTLSSTEKNDHRVASYQVAQSGGTAGGDLASKIKLIKQDAEDGNIVLANAVFTVTKPDNTTFELTTGADGTITSGILEQGAYKVKEKTAPYGYLLNDEEFTLNVSPAGGAIQTVTDKPIKINVEGTKTWDDANNQDGKRPTKIKVNLLADGTKVQEQEVQADGDGNWKYSFTNLRKVKNGVDIVYTVTEEAVDGYTTQINGLDITNKHIPEVTEVAGTKTWDDANDQDRKRPTKIKVNLLADGTKVQEQEVQADGDGNWKYSFTNLPKFKNGVEIVYTVTEEAVDGYTTEINGFDITNKYTPEVTEVAGTK
ncbi:MAG: Cna B-type domain-containing protein, partial [Eubacteriales bacterium]|nr:Cna B-type domain-containing protein [Eubacteriales bacterium]